MRCRYNSDSPFNHHRFDKGCLRHNLDKCLVGSSKTDKKQDDSSAPSKPQPKDTGKSQWRPIKKIAVGTSGVHKEKLPKDTLNHDQTLEIPLEQEAQNISQVAEKLVGDEMMERMVA
ncbi:hypothetical protein ACH5RR_003256 [Cinchona calisaya]|uniref:Uncharacterized protein n=1 Tax=Cinchona calisaya TaxID=153742 RepID=A0ABD3AUC8_9GENT